MSEKQHIIGCRIFIYWNAKLQLVSTLDFVNKSILHTKTICLQLISQHNKTQAYQSIQY